MDTQALRAGYPTFRDLPHGFQTWLQAVATILPAEVIALDGKTVRGSHDGSSGKRAIHMVSAWAATNRVVLAQIKFEDNTQRVPDEITALPELLGQLALAGCIVTIDAMGCQREIARVILDHDGDYVLALKGNQGTLEQDVQLSFAAANAEDWTAITHDQAGTMAKANGRIETRRALVIDDPAVLDWVQERHDWPGVQAIGMVRAERRIGSERTSEARFYLLSHPLSAAACGEAVRSNGGIENRVHWVLDLTFHEDQSRIRAGYAAENFVVLRHIALNLLQRQQPKRLSLKAKRKKAGWDNAYLLRVLQGV